MQKLSLRFLLISFCSATLSPLWCGGHSDYKKSGGYTNSRRKKVRKYCSGGACTDRCATCGEVACTTCSKPCTACYSK